MLHLKIKNIYQYILTPVVIYIFLEWVGLIVLMEGEDKEFHLMALLDGIVKPTEPLWGVIALYIGSAFNADPFAAAVFFVYGLTVAGMIMNKISYISSILIMFSPGMVYLSSQALRQGFAIGFFLFSLGAVSLFFKRKSEQLGVIHLFLIAIPAILIHNSMAIVLMWLIISRGLIKIKYTVHSKLLSLFFLGFSFFLIAPSITEEFNNSALLIFLVQFIIFINSLIYKENRVNNLQISLILVACIAGFIFTISGLRVVVMIVLLSALVRLKGEKIILILGLIVYPIFSSFFFGGGLDKVLPLQ